MAMDKAAEDGNLEMVKWLHHNRTEGCSTFAVDLAAASGHLDVINCKFLAENRTEGGTFAAYEFAEEEGHLEILRWFDEHKPTFLEH
ncbi:hypothetical protein PF011_g7418 [Phytophthora fragariae]|nr:hypothetical protein PF011_g7418 [Phytophthora fragariae]